MKMRKTARVSVPNPRRPAERAESADAGQLRDICHELLKILPELSSGAHAGDDDLRRWIERFRSLAEQFGVALPPSKEEAAGLV
ncbi:MAG TPA: hypothetical protein VH643_24295, partial [Gemmataceae bacterium]